MHGDAPHSLESLLLADGRALRRLARGLLSSADADDAVHDACVAALAAPQRPRDLGKWLRGALYNLGALRHRAEARRRVREAAVARDAVDDTHDPAALAARAETIAAVAAAVQALDEPYRAAIVLRYWHGLEAEQVARRLGVPHNTVRSQLQRGIALLRRRLDERCAGRERWSLALGALALPNGAGVGSPTSLAIALGIAMKTKWILAAAAAALLAAFAFLGSAPDAPASASGATVVAASAAQEAPGDSAEPPPSRQLAASTESPPPHTATGSGVDAAHFVVRGRCVAEDGRALPGCAVAVRARWPLAIEATREIVVGSSDPQGGFELSFVPDVSSCTVRIVAPGRVAVHADVADLAPGRERDFGDVVLPMGGGVDGRVVDERGAPVADVPVLLLAVDEPEAEPASVDAAAPRAETGVRATTAPDGSFRVLGRLASGAWQATIEGVGPTDDRRQRTFRVDVGVVARVELVCPDATASLRGVVVDAGGMPIAGANVLLAGVPFAAPGRCADDGSFTLLRFGANAAQSVELLANAPGYEARLAGPLRWGDDDVRIELTRTAATTLELVRDDDGSPVERAALRVSQAPGTSQGLTAQLALPLLARPAGRVALEGLPSGDYVVFVEPEAEDLASCLRMVPVGSTAQPVRVRVPRAAPRTVRVVDGRDQPVVGTELQLLLTIGEHGVGPATPTEPWAALAGIGALRVAQSMTDARGEAVLYAGAGTQHTLLALGPGHRPLAVPRVTCGEELEPLIVRVEVGATVFGEVTPRHVLDQLGPSASERRFAASLGEPGAAQVQRWQPQIELTPIGRREPLPLGASEGRIAADGSYRIDGVPPGSWQVRLRVRVRGPDGNGSSALVVPLAEVRDLGETESRRVDLDVAALATGTLHALVFVDGEPLRDGGVSLLYRREGQFFGQKPTLGAALAARTDADGRLRADLLPGDWALEVEVLGRDGRTATLRNEQLAVVVPGAVTECTFTMQRRSLTVRILRADGEPEVGRKFSILQPGAWLPGGTTDAEGRLVLESLPNGPFELVTWPVELADTQAQTAFIRKHPYPEWLAELIRLGPVVPPVGGGAAGGELVLRLPR